MEIKFRGKDRRGNIFFGTYDEKTATIDDFDYASSHAVEPETVAQLATHDDEDNEVYTGDEVHADNGEDYRVELRPVFVNLDGGEILLNPPKHFTLKK